MDNKPMITARRVRRTDKDDLDVFSVRYIHPNKLPEPYVEIDRDRFDMLHFQSAHLCDVYAFDGSIGIEKIYGMWTATYHYHLVRGYVLARLSQYFHRSKDAEDVAGIWLPKIYDDGQECGGYRVRFFKLGCQHPKEERWRENPRMHEHREGCNLCGWKWGYDSSG